jgi:NADH:ubiquinone oxidoreductase subunit 5 (subunit L)/multisubunit Na+/H+ antiporter MnhA subunit
LAISADVLSARDVSVVDVATWLDMSIGAVRWSLAVDTASAALITVVSVVSLIVMAGDPHTPRFGAYLLLFCFLMLVFVSADGLLQAFIGWEGVGLASFLVVGFWMGRAQAGRSAVKALIFNRVGDFGLCLGLAATWSLFGSLDYATLGLLACLH